MTLTLGMTVTIRTSNKRYNQEVWKVASVVQEDVVQEDGKVLLVSPNVDHPIRVHVDKVFAAEALAVPVPEEALAAPLPEEALAVPANLTLALMPAQRLPDYSNHLRDEDVHWNIAFQERFFGEGRRPYRQFLDRWVPLPGRGGCSIKLTQRVSAEDGLDLAMFPGLINVPCFPCFTCYT